MEKLLVDGPKIQVDVSVVEYVPCGANIVKLHIRAGCLEVCQHARCQAGTTVLFAENLDRDSLRHASQQVESLYIQVVAWLRHAFF